MRIESSIMSSLSELKAIHHERIADEQASFERARMAEIEARRSAEEAVRAAEAAKLREERDAQVRIEEARVAAEREARLKLEAAEASQRARYAAELEQQRQLQETELRRAEIAKQRPKWMIAVTGVAIAAGLALGVFAIQSAREAEAARAKQVIAEHEKQLAHEQAAQARIELEGLEKAMDSSDAKLGELTRSLQVAQNDADRLRIKHQIDEQNKIAADNRKRIDDINAKKWKHDRDQTIDQKNCLDTPLGCLTKH
jgi:hypothetical protein